MKKLSLSKIQLLLLFLLPVILFLVSYKILSKDFWFSINEGKYIINNGFPTTVLFTLHKNFYCVLQSWGSLVIFFLIYNYLGSIGMYLWIILMMLLILFVLYKICMLISRKNITISIILSLNTILGINIFLDFRPQMFTFLNLLMLIFLLELYIKNNKIKYLIPLPLIALCQINLHGIFFFMLFIFMIPYIIDSFDFKIFDIKSESYRLKPILITMIIMFLMGFINPYGIKTITYVFTSYFSKNLNSIGELMSFISMSLIYKIIYIPIFICIIYYWKNRRNIKLRYILLSYGTCVLALMTFRNIALYSLVTFFPLAFIFKNNYNLKNKKIFNCISVIIVVVFLFVINNKSNPFKFDLIKVVDKLESKYVIKNKTVYTDAENGGYLGYRGMLPYIDCRAEMFLKSNNKKKDIQEEYILLQTGKINYKNFINEYDFDYIIVENKIGETMYKYMKNDNYKYKLIEEYHKYRVYARKEMN